jgi:dehydrogenase/reductase SDR family protein 7B
MQSKTIWITGASSGIGKQLALQYAALKYSLILSSRRETELAEVASLCEKLDAKCLVLPFDLASIADVEQLVDKALSL